MSDVKKQVLGRGLSALLGGAEEDQDDSKIQNNVKTASYPEKISIDLIEPGTLQPRKNFSEEELEELSRSIYERGVLQPILVRPHPFYPNRFEIIAGERRWRASKMAGLSKIPVNVMHFSDLDTLEAGLLENIQRQDLNPIEEAEGYLRLMNDYDYTQEDLSSILGKSRSHIANYTRLLNLPKPVQNHIVCGKLSAGHGRALIGAEDAEVLAEQIIKKNLSVRQTEDLMKKTKKEKDPSFSIESQGSEKEVLESHLTNLLGLSVDLVLKGAGGRIIIPFKNPGELDQVIQKFNTLEKET